MIPRSSFYKKRCAIRQCRTYPAYVPPASARPGGADTAQMQHECGTIGAKRGTNRPATLSRCLTAASCCRNSLTIMRIGNVTGGKHTRHFRTRTVAFCNDITCLVCIQIGFEDI